MGMGQTFCSRTARVSLCSPCWWIATPRGGETGQHWCLGKIPSKHAKRPPLSCWEVLLHGCCHYFSWLKLNVKGTKFTDTTCTFILPHKLFSTLFNFKHTAFGKFIVGGDVSNIKTFWTTFQDHPLLTARPVLKGRKDLSTKVIPLGIHGDGVQYMQIHRAGGKGLDVLSWSSLLTKGPTKLSYWIMFLVVKSCVKIAGLGCTWVKVWKVLAWSFEALAKGKWPQADWEGQPFAEDTIDFQKKGQDLADGYCGVILLLKADLEFLASHFQLNHTSSNFPCCLCKADRQMTSRPWTDCRLQAAWRETSWTKDSWAAEHPDCHPFFRMCDNGIDMVYPDLMHSKHLGTDQVLLGSILSWLSKSFLPDTAKNNLEYVWDWIKDWQKDSCMHGRATPHRHSKMILLGVPTMIWLSKEKKREGTFSKTKGLSWKKTGNEERAWTLTPQKSGCEKKSNFLQSKRKSKRVGVG